MWHSLQTDQPNFRRQKAVGDPCNDKMDEIRHQIFHKMNQTRVRVVSFHFDEHRDAIFQPCELNNRLLSSTLVRAFLRGS